MTEEILLIGIKTEKLLAVTWANDNNSLYFVSISSSSEEENNLHKTEWKDVIRYRQRKSTDNSTIHRIDITRKNRRIFVRINTITNINFHIGELLFVSTENKLIFISVSAIVENPNVFEIYSINLHNDDLSNLKFFSLTCYNLTNAYDNRVISLFHRMINLEKLTLYIRIADRPTFVDGTHLHKEILMHMSQLHTFIFYISTMTPINDSVHRYI
ncbi:unnamed protein product [Rotaria sordida]|uniref:Uncharacterized protein n=2 Tax=Rotaria sordida TaxID=392033 RepID=A0A819H9J3_9BILA|nr:unnamed protein product [Rotaria sordida]CAF1412005.1 unnamed protein product [Rotaria sordida]CAF3896361.1 unnamed protein product [Rotaria sordida]